MAVDQPHPNHLASLDAGELRGVSTPAQHVLPNLVIPGVATVRLYLLWCGAL
jgi:hypothetical protein